MKDDPSQWITSGLTCRQVADRTTDSLAERLPLLTGVRLGGASGDLRRLPRLCETDGADPGGPGGSAEDLSASHRPPSSAPVFHPGSFTAKVGFIHLL